MISFSSSGSFVRMDAFLQSMSRGAILGSLEGYGHEGVMALQSATPVDSGATAAAWDFEVKRSGGTYSIYWTNGHLDANGSPVAILLQYGHGTGTGGYVQGKDYINPALRPVFDRIAENVWKAVTSA